MNTELRNLTQTQRIELWSKRIADCLNSGKSVSVWCAENKLNPKTYYYWQKRIFKQVTAHNSTQFIEINPEPIHNIRTPKYLEDRRLELSNNRAERGIKPFVMSRKNFLFANTPSGATGSATMFSLIETAKENGLNPFRYLAYVFQTAPNMDLKQAENIQ